MLIRGPSLPLALYRSRRDAAVRVLAQRAGGPVPLLVLGRPASTHHVEPTPLSTKPRQDAWFDWCCGCQEADAGLLIDPTTPRRDTLFLEVGDPKRVIWDGERLPPGREACQAFGVMATAPARELAGQVADAAGRCDGRLALLWRQKEEGWQSTVARQWRRRLRGITCLNAEPWLVPLRMLKAPEEIALHRKAVALTARGLAMVLPRIPRLRTEAEVAAMLDAAYTAPHREPLAFASIVASGSHAATLHYPHCDQPLVRGCLLIDSGATWGGYCADVTRTLPRNGCFGRRLAEIYRLVLHCNELGRQHARPGITLKELDEIAFRPIIDAGFTKHHRLSHHIGLDVHDPCDRDLPLAAGMLISDEPGIYLPDEGIGVRIEDDLLITAYGCEVTTRAIPKDPEAIAAAMRA